MSKNWHKIVGLVAACMFTVVAWGQVQNSNITTRLNSPLSRFGLGDPVRQYFSHAAAMGGLSAAWQDENRINMQNPASLASLRWTAFEGGIYAKNSKYTADGKSDNTWSGNLQYVALGFPLRNKINQALDRKSNVWDAGMALALMPYSQVGYDIELINTSTPGVEQSTNTLKGTGGLTRFRWGTGARYKDLSVGFDVGFLFGEIINSRLVQFDSLAGSLRTEFRDDLNVNATVWNFGAQYAFEFEELNKRGEMVPSGRRIVLGAYTSNEAKLKTEGTEFARRFLGGVTSDTLVFDDTQKGTGTLPASFTFGVNYQDINKFNIGVEYGISKWDNYTNSLKDEKMSDTYFIAVGGEYIPKYNSYNRYWERVRYRAGFRHATDPRSLEGEQISETAVSLGFGLPVILPRQQISFINLSVELGQSGVKDVFEEKYVRLNLGFTLNDNSWFFKRKFN